MAKPKTTETTETQDTKPTAPPRHCACGCGAEVRKKSDWRQGHDARAKGWLQRVSAGRCFEGERDLAAAMLANAGAQRALSTETFAPLAAAARAKLS